MEDFLLKYFIKYKNTIKILTIFIAAFAFVSICLEERAYASGLLDYGNGNNPFNNINDSWGQFVADKYRNNYSLDAGNIGTFDVLDKALNGLSNALFFLLIMIAWLGINVFNFCFNANISETFSKSLDTISQALHNGLFDKFFMMFFMVSLIAVVIYFVKRNFSALFTHIIGVALIAVMALVINSSGARNFVVETTNFSKEIGMTLVASLSGESNTEVAKNDMIGTLWGNLVHKPWVILEFDGEVGVDDANKTEAIEKSKKILSLAEGSDEREEIVKKEITDVSFTGRLASTFILGAITIVKIAILILIGVIQIFLQILSNIMIIISPLILLMAIVPFFGGFNLLKWIGEKYLGIQVNIVLLSFVIGSLILIDKVILEFFLELGASFTVALLIQCVCWILLIVFRKQLVLNLHKFQRRINGTLATGKILNKGLDKVADYGNKAASYGDKVVDPVKRGAVNLAGAAGEQIRYASKYTTGKAGIAASKFTGDVIDKVTSKWSKSGNKNNGFNEEQRFNQSAIVEKDEKVKEVQAKEKLVDIKDKLKNRSNNIKNSLDNTKEKVEKIETSNEGVNIRKDLNNRESIKEESKLNGIQDNLERINEKSEESKVNDVGVNIEKELDNRGSIKEESRLNNVHDNLEKTNEKLEESISNNIQDNFESTKEKITEDRAKDEGINLKENIDSRESINKDIGVKSKEIQDNANEKKIVKADNKHKEPKVISMNDARVKKGQEKVNSEELKDILRKDLQREYRENQREKKEKLEKAKAKSRAEVLKNKLGVSSSKIKEKERKLNKELKEIKRNKSVKLNKK